MHNHNELQSACIENPLRFSAVAEHPKHRKERQKWRRSSFLHFLARLAVIQFGLKRLNLHLQRVVLFHLAFQEPAGQCHLFGNTLGREQVDILELVFALLEVAHLHKALVDEGVEAVVQPTHAHAEHLGQLALGQVRVILQDAHDPEMGVFLDLGLSAGHNCAVFWLVVRSVNALGTLPPCRVTIGWRGLGV